VSPDAIGFVNGFRGEALGTSAALCTVCSHCDIAHITKGGYRVIHFALQALQLHATPANPSPHTNVFELEVELSRKHLGKSIQNGVTIEGP